MIGFDRVGADDGQRFDQFPQMARAARRRHALLQASAVSEQAHAIAGRHRHLRQRERRRRRRVEHRLGSDARAQQTS